MNGLPRPSCDTTSVSKARPREPRIDHVFANQDAHYAALIHAIESGKYPGQAAACRPRGDTSDKFDLCSVEDDIDHMGHVNNVVYLSWVQDVVVRHWSGMATEAEIAAYLWMALKHEITYRRPAFLGDPLRATVVATGFLGARAMFDTVIRRGDLIVAEIKSVWCALDAATKRPMRVAQDVVRRFTVDVATTG